ncbi:MAG: hypothetical protein GXP02_01435 [Alphaproteobacteria bacterium]|nr:hypothetical protein [Alphaproteobacteria bacterium]
MKYKLIHFIIIGSIGFSTAIAVSVSPSSAGVMRYNAYFTKKQGMWGNNRIANISQNSPIFSLLKPRFFNQSVGSIKNVTVKVPVKGNVNLGSYGARVSARMGVNLGIGLNSSFTGGTVDTRYPVQFSIDIPDLTNARVGDKVTIRTSYKILPGSNISSKIGEATLSLNAKMNISGNVSTTTCLRTCNSKSYYNINENRTTTLFKAKNSNLKLNLSIADMRRGVAPLADAIASGALSLAGINKVVNTPSQLAAFLPSLGFKNLAFEAPSLTTNGSTINGAGLLGSSNSQNILGLDWSLTKLATSMACPFKFCPTLSGGYASGTSPFGYNLFKDTEKFSVGLKQKFGFVANTPSILLKFGNGSSQIIKAGDALTVTLGKDGLNLRPTFLLGGKTSNLTNLTFGRGIDWSSMALWAKFSHANIAIPYTKWVSRFVNETYNKVVSGWGFVTCPFHGRWWWNSKCWKKASRRVDRGGNKSFSFSAAIPGFNVGSSNPLYRGSAYDVNDLSVFNRSWETNFQSLSGKTLKVALGSPAVFPLWQVRNRRLRLTPPPPA